jgi:hypothetical protein
MTKQIEVLDALPGSGKTYAILEYISKHKEVPWLYITPMLSELEERIPVMSDKFDLDFMIPESDLPETKSSQVLDFLKEGKHIACTHELTLRFTPEHIKEISLQGYNVVCDEELSLIEAFKLDRSDFEFLHSHNLIEKDITNLGKMKFLDQDMSYEAKYGQVKKLCDRGCLYGAKDNDNMLVTYLSPDLILASKRFILLTYNFGGSVMSAFLSLHNITHSYLDIPLYRSNLKNKQELIDLIEFIEPPSVKKFHEKQGYYSLSASWWDRHIIDRDVNQVKVKKLISSLPKTQKVSSSKVFYTVPLHSLSKVKSTNASASNLLTFNIRATNKYEDKEYAIHALNVFSNVTVNSYLKGYGFIFDEDAYALNTAIQWLFRGCIRTRKRMKVTFLSKRMNVLFKEWLLM